MRISSGASYQPTLPMMGSARKKAPPHEAGPPRFAGGGGAVQGLGKRVLERFDFRALGVSPLDQLQLIYASCIGWRLAAANERRKQSPTQSWNEVREIALRDSLGFTFWFFATPILQRLFLQGVRKRNPEMGRALVQENPETRKATGLMGSLKRWFPLTRLNIPTSEQVKDQMEQALHALKSQGVGKTEPSYQKTERFYQDLLKWRNSATALGLGTTIALLGIGINFLNFYLTRKNMERRQHELQDAGNIPAFKQAPHLTAHASPPASLGMRGGQNRFYVPRPLHQSFLLPAALHAPSPSFYPPFQALNGPLPSPPVAHPLPPEVPLGT